MNPWDVVPVGEIPEIPPIPFVDGYPWRVNIAGWLVRVDETYVSPSWRSAMGITL